MTLSPRSTRSSVLVAGLFAAGSSLVLAAPAANAAPASLTTTYTCTSSLLGTNDFTGTITTDLPASVVSGATVPSRAISITVTVPAAVLDNADPFAARPPAVTSISGTATGATYRVGDSLTVPVTGAVLPATPIPATGDLVLNLTATAGSFTAPAPGSYDIKVPVGLTVNGTAQTVIGPVNDAIGCALRTGSPEVLGTVEVTANPNPPAVPVASTTSLKVKNKPVTTRTKARLAVTVAATGRVPTGTVTAKLGKKVLKTGSLKSGKVTLKLPKLKKGKRKIVVTYGGDKLVKASSKAITIKVKRA